MDDAWLLFVRSGCAETSKGGEACKGIPAWRCRECYQATCGIHIVRGDSGAVCVSCGGPVHLFRRKVKDRRRRVVRAA
jgi:hypothetical protein